MKIEENLQQQLAEQGVFLGWHRLGIVTGLSPESSAEYYAELCLSARERLGRNNNPEFVTDNVNFDFVEALMKLERWDVVEAYITESMLRLEQAGVEALAVCSNTIHRILDHAQNALQYPIIHIGDCVAAEIKRNQCLRVGLLGTKTTMEQDFIASHLRRSGAEIIVPLPKQHGRIDNIIFDQLCHGAVYMMSRDFLLKVIEDMIIIDGIDGVVLGCTELSLAIDSEHQASFVSRHPGFKFFDSEKLHVGAMLDFCCSGKLPEI